MKFAPMAIPAMALLQLHDARRDILIEPAACSDRSSGGIRNWGRNRAVKTNRLVVIVSQCSRRVLSVLLLQARCLSILSLAAIALKLENDYEVVQFS